jgi:hypothetical protein
MILQKAGQKSNYKKSTAIKYGRLYNSFDSNKRYKAHKCKWVALGKVHVYNNMKYQQKK